MTQPPVQIKRIYQAAGPDDGQRVLVDRLWPRGISKERAALDLWLPEVAPSNELRTWFNHDDERWNEFEQRYREELRTNTHLETLVELSRHGSLTLLYGAKNEAHNQAVVLRAVVAEQAVEDR